jgi:hypothetical protein
MNGGITYRFIKSRPANEDNSIVAKGYFLLMAQSIILNRNMKPD